MSFLRKKIHGPGWRQTQRECPGKLRAKSTKVWAKKIDRFRSGGEHSRTGGEHLPIRAHTWTRSRSWARRNHKTLTNLWRSKGLWRWALLSNVRTFALTFLLWLGLGATTCIEGMLPACSCVCDRPDEWRKDTKTSEFDKKKTAPSQPDCPCVSRSDHSAGSKESASWRALNLELRSDWHGRLGVGRREKEGKETSGRGSQDEPGQDKEENGSWTNSAKRDKCRRWRKRRKYRHWRKRERRRAGIEPTAAAPSQPDCPGVSRSDQSAG